MELISSTSNPKIKLVRSLRQRKARQEAGLFIVEGIHHVGEAVAAARDGRVRLHSLFFAPDLLVSEFGKQLVQQAGAGVTCHAVATPVFKSIAEKENPAGILVVATIHQPELSALRPSSYPWLVALVAPQDPGNVGAILRSIDAVGASGLLLLDSSVDPYNPAAVRASMGALFWYPVVQASFAEFSAWAQHTEVRVIGTSAKAELDYRQIDYPSPRVLLLGSERQGLSAEQQAVCSLLVRMPMKGRVSSLNLAVAAGVMLYQMLET